MNLDDLKKLQHKNTFKEVLKILSDITLGDSNYTVTELNKVFGKKYIDFCITSLKEKVNSL